MLPRSVPSREPRDPGGEPDRRCSSLSLLLYCASITSTMLNVKVDKSDPTDLYEQVAGDIRRAIAEGEAKPGERLPPAKDLAAVLGVNTNTVLRSLRVLRDEGLLEFRRGRGISVAGTPERGAVVQRARELVEFARHQGTTGRAGPDHRRHGLTKAPGARRGFSTSRRLLRAWRSGRPRRANDSAGGYRPGQAFEPRTAASTNWSDGSPGQSLALFTFSERHLL